MTVHTECKADLKAPRPSKSMPPSFKPAPNALYSSALGAMLIGSVQSGMGRVFVVC